MKILLLAPLAVLLLQVQLNPLQQQPRPQGSIEGLVTRSGTNQPVPSARVTLTRPSGPRGTGSLPPLPPVTTDDKGKFVFSGLDENTYTVQVLANGYVAQPYGQRYPNGPGTPITLRAGQSVKDANVSLTPTANVSGRVRDTSDQPLINIPVQLLRYSYDFNGQRTYQSAGATLTNDRGEYRMYWVTPGRYYMLAGRPTTGANPLESLIMAELGGGGANGNEVPAVLGYAFYPGATEIANARTIDLQPGADLQAIDLAMALKPRTYAIRGKVIDSRTGQPPPRANVMVATQTPGLNAGGNNGFMIGPEGSGQNYNAKTGTLEIRDLLPGTYSVIAMVQDPPVPGRGGPPSQATGMIPVTISSSNVDGITISVVPGVSVPGRIRVDGQLPASQTIDRFRVSLTPVGTSGAAQMMQGAMASSFYQNTQAQVAADGTFRLNNVVPGDFRLNVCCGAYLKEARFEGQDALSTPLRFSGASNSALDIVVGIGGGRVDGTLTDSRSQPVAGTRVVFVPDRARFRTDLYSYVTTDPNGRFGMSPLAPGDYKAFAWESLEENAWYDPDVIARAEQRGTPFHVTETSSQTINVKIIPAEGAR